MVVISSKHSTAHALSGHEDHIRSLCKYGRVEEAFKVVDCMEKQHLSLSRDIVYSLLQGCKGVTHLVYARRVRFLMRKHGLSSIAALADPLIRIFTACGSLHEANEAFFDVSKPSVFTWNSLISAHAKLGEGGKALRLYEKMQQAKVIPDRVTFVCMSHACGCVEALIPGMHVHHQAIRHGFESNLVLGNALIDMYANCGCLAEADKLFDAQVEKDIITWTVMISGYTAQGQGLPALEQYAKMHGNHLKPNKAVMLCAIRACACEGASNEGQLIHAEILDDGLESDTFLMSALVDMYAKCGCLAEAGNVFGVLSARDVVAWSAMIHGYAQSDHTIATMQAFERMLQENVDPNEATFSGILRACSTLGTSYDLRLIHSHIVEEGLETNVVVGSALVDMYAKCEFLEDTYVVFTRLANRNVVCWGAVISGLLDCGQVSRAVELFNELLLEGIEPSNVVCLCVLKACSNLEAIEHGLLIHVLVIEMGFEADKAIGNTLVDFYAKKGDLDAARIVFSHLSNPDSVSFGALIAGYSRQGWNDLALDLFDEMQKQGVFPDKATFLSLLKACSIIGAVGQGHLIHEQIVINGFESLSFVSNALVHMYAKAGKLNEARQLCANTSNYDVVSCASIIEGYKDQGNLKAVTQFIQDLHQVGCDPDNAMYASILTAYSSAGLLDEGYDLFTFLCGSSTSIPTQEHCSSIIDLLGRTGQLLVAEDMSMAMPTSPDLIMETSLFANFKTYNSMKPGRQCLGKLVEQDPVNSSQ